MALLVANQRQAWKDFRQHPQRLREGAYSAEVDRFPVLLIATTLGCLKSGGRALWERYDNGDNMLFREGDLLFPRTTELAQRR